jgi:hypothetical protein
MGKTTAEHQRLQADARREANWKRWGPYLAERQWGTVREDYSGNGDCWNYLTHDQSRSRAYRWGEDGLLGFCDRECRLCFAIALWNGKDPILKERLFGLSGPEGNHGEDVKELYYYLDSSPTHSYMKALYKYPKAEFPYVRLVEENRYRGRGMREFEITDTGIFDDNRYCDVFAEYAKGASADDILIKITIVNHSKQRSPIHVLPTLWFRNSWSWGCTHEGCEVKPWMRQAGPSSVEMSHVTLGQFRFELEAPDELLFTENETNAKRLFNAEIGPRFAKDAFDDYVIHGDNDAVNPEGQGTKFAGVYKLELDAGQSVTIHARLFPADQKPTELFGRTFEQIFRQRQEETDEFYDAILPPQMNGQERAIARQSYAGLLWSKQFYHYVVGNWLDGDPDQPPPPPERKRGRNSDWRHLFNRDVISMPDKWEYPWYAAWDLAFHMIPMAKVDPEFAKEQLVLLLREWYMHPNGQLPAYEFSFSDVNPPVHAWAVWRVYKMTGTRGNRDKLFLARCFQKLLINFTWWVNRKDVEGKNIFGGGFLGLDNIGIFDRSKPLPGGGRLEQADGTAWMAFYCGTMLSMALELARYDASYEDVASKFFEHFVAIVDAINTVGGTGLWDEDDGFYYDQLQLDGRATPLKTRSLVGVLPLIACEVMEEVAISKLPGFRKRMQWFLDHRKDLARFISFVDSSHCAANKHAHYLLSIPSKEKLIRALKYVLDEKEFLSPFGLRSLSRIHMEHPFMLQADGQSLSVHYTPGESDSGLFGGNSNWRGPIWFPINFLLIEALERYHHYYGDELKVECPTGSGNMMTLKQVAQQLAKRLAGLFIPDRKGYRPCHGGEERYAIDPNFRDLVLFYEHFHGDSGRGLGASHQTGWTALASRFLEITAKSRVAEIAQEPPPAIVSSSPVHA